MGYFIAFGLVYIGYTLVDWGHYIANHQSISLWWLMSGLGPRDGGTSTSTPPVTPGGKTSVPTPTSSGGRPFNPKGNIGAL